MTPKYYPISELQTSNTSLISVVRNLGVDSLTAAELGNMLVNLKSFLCEMRNDLHVIVEGVYVDSVYRDSYYDYYSTKHSSYNRFCLRKKYVGFTS